MRDEARSSIKKAREKKRSDIKQIKTSKKIRKNLNKLSELK